MGETFSKTVWVGIVPEQGVIYFLSDKNCVPREGDDPSSPAWSSVTGSQALS